MLVLNYLKETVIYSIGNVEEEKGTETKKRIEKLEIFKNKKIMEKE